MTKSLTGGMAAGSCSGFRGGRCGGRVKVVTEVVIGTRPILGAVVYNYCHAEGTLECI